MIRNKVTFGILAFALAISCCIAGCSSSQKQDEESTATTKKSQVLPKKNAVRIEDIKWQVKSVAFSGDRYFALSYTNNSNYTISKLAIKFARKQTTTNEQILKEFSKLHDYDLSDQEILEGIFAGGSLKSVAPSSTSEYRPLELDSANDGITSIEQYNLFEPDIMILQYIDDGKLYTENYDFQSREYTIEPDAFDTTQWPKNRTTSKIPRPKDMLLTELNYDDDSLNFTMSDVTLAQFEEYVSSSKKAGFTSEPSEYAGNYSAKT